MFLSKSEIQARLTDLIVVKADPNCIQEACYDLRVGNEAYRSEEHLPQILSDEEPYLLLHPGQFALIKTLECVRIPADCVGFISIRSRYKFQGLVNVSGFHVDPTYRGHLIFAVQNVGPNDVRLKYEERAFMIMWAQLSVSYEGKSRDGYPNIPLELMAQLGGGGITLSQLRNRVDGLQTELRLLIGIGVAILTALVILLLRQSLGFKG
jgi:dCTP deaminase